MPGVYPPGLGPIVCYSQQPPNTYVTGTPFTAPFPFPPAGLPCIPDYRFAFQSVTGLVEGGQISTNIMAPCSGTVGTSPILVTNVYIPPGGTGPGGESGAIIDAFNAETGQFCDDTFVTVSPDSGGNLTSSGNVYGWVSSQGGDETITAYTHIMPSDMYFHDWQIVEGTGTSADNASGAALTVGAGTNPYAFAFYGRQQKSFYKDIKDLMKEWLADKPVTIDSPRKDLASELPKWKDAAGEGDPWKNIGGPVEQTIQGLVDKVSNLEQQIKEMGQSFIRIQERPVVGKEIAAQGFKPQ